MEFKLKKDIWITIIFLGIILFLAWFFYYFTFVDTVTNIHKDRLKLSNRVLSIMIILFLSAICFKTKYLIYDKYIIIQCLLVEKSIHVHSIKSIRYVNSISIAPAFSTKRIEITYDTVKTIQIAPKDRDEFVNELLKVYPYIRIIK